MDQTFKKYHSPIVPLVSISVITYNHKKYISRAIDSVLKQKIDFPIEIIIGDDFSSDGTREILNNYQEKYPDIIHLILHPRRYQCIPGRVNNITNLYACRGKYIAMLDGDDFWISDDKLQLQVDFLQKNADFSLSFHAMIMAYEGGKNVHLRQFCSFINFDNSVFEHNDVLEGFFIQVSSMLFRNGLIGEFPEWFWQVNSADYALQLMLSKKGKIKYFSDLLGERTMHEKSFSANYMYSLGGLRTTIKQYKLFKKHFPGFKPQNSTRGLMYIAFVYYIRRIGVYGPIKRLQKKFTS